MRLMPSTFSYACYCIIFRTKRNLHAHQEIAPISKNLYQVTGYGEVRAFNYVVFQIKLIGLYF